jgi:hypothetical protein
MPDTDPFESRWDDDDLAALDSSVTDDDSRSALDALDVFAPNGAGVATTPMLLGSTSIHLTRLTTKRYASCSSP